MKGHAMNLQTIEEALGAIGAIAPWFDADIGYWRFVHPLFPDLDVFDDTPETVICKYRIHLEELLADYRRGNVATVVVKATPAWGGRRKGAGRPRKEPSRRISVPIKLAEAIQRLGVDKAMERLQA